MKITILCSSAEHPVNAYLQRWQAVHSSEHQIDIARRVAELGDGDLLFLISCSEVITAEARQKYSKVLVIHASDLPQGRGWSPHIWEIIGGATEITVTLLEAANQVDSGDIWAKHKLAIPKDALYEEINDLLFATELQLMDLAINEFTSVKPQPQNNGAASYYQRRSAADSEIDPQQSIAEQFNLIRVCDAERFPAFFKLHGKTYKLKLEKVGDE